MRSLQVGLIFCSSLIFADCSLVNPVDVILKRGYPAEAHVVVSKDGYSTILHRIPYGSNPKKIGDPVFIAHGLGSSSGDYTNAPTGKGLCYILADAGYDVWLSNTRGNSYSFQIPSRLKENLKAYYNYSFHEIGMYDYPAQIDYVLSKTGKKKLFYIGHSQGGTAFFAMTSKNPEYNEKIRLASLFGVPTIMRNIGAHLRFAANLIDTVELVANFLNLYQLPFIQTMRSVLPGFCYVSINRPICRIILNVFLGYDDSEQLDGSMLPIIFQSIPSDSGLKCIYHFAQLIRHGVFQEYDYGPKLNLRHYGSRNPPPYNLSQVKVPVAFYYGMNDQFLEESDVNKLCSLLPNVVHKYRVKWNKWNHGDFLIANDVVPLLYDEVLGMMKNY